MKRRYTYKIKDKTVEKQISYIPLRFIIAMLLTIAEIATIIAIVFILCYYVPYFYVLAYITEIACVLKIIASSDNPDYKVPWLVIVLVLPVAGFMLYLMLYSRTFKKKYVKRLRDLKDRAYQKDDLSELEEIEKENETACAQAKMLCKIADTHIFSDTDVKYFSSGKELCQAMISDLKGARKFIFLEYFIIEQGVLWNEILEILKEKASAGVEVKVVYDDIGCMNTLPPYYYFKLRKYGIDAVPFSILRAGTNGEFNNRSHRKIAVIDGSIGYTGGINLADEYINEIKRFGHWKDTGIRLEGNGVWELTRLFVSDYGVNVKNMPKSRHNYYPVSEKEGNNGYIIPFGDGPRPLYQRPVGKSVIQGMLDTATKYAYITTPYLIIDSELCQSLENAALRGVDVRIITPHIPDKRIVFSMTRSFYPRLLDAGVKIYEYESGFIHAKTYLTDDEYAMLGTINLDYRSLVHHFENGVFMYNAPVIADIKSDFEKTLKKSIKIEKQMLKSSLPRKLFRAMVRIFAPLL